MKKFYLYATMLCTAVLLFGCGDSATSAPAASAENQLADNQVLIDSVTVSLDENMADVLSAFGDDYEYSEVKSCLYDGFDKTYTYDDFSIITYPQGEQDFVSSITITNTDDVSSIGLSVGASVEDLENAFSGKDLSKSKVCYLYEDGQIGYAFYLDDGLVTSIETYKITD